MVSYRERGPQEQADFEREQQSEQEAFQRWEAERAAAEASVREWDGIMGKAAEVAPREQRPQRARVIHSDGRSEIVGITMLGEPTREAVSRPAIRGTPATKEPGEKAT